MTRWWVLGSAVAVAACGGKAQDHGAGADPCADSADALLTCVEDDCDLDALNAELAACSVDDKADGIGDTFREWMTRIQAKLAAKAKACFDAKDAACLERVYWVLAAGAKVKGMPNAAAMMWNFLGCDDDPAEVDADAIQADKNAASVIDGHAVDAWDQAEALLAMGATGAQELTVAARSLGADSADIWYAMGNFSIRADATAVLGSGKVASVELRYVAFDRYDWHAGMSAGGEAEGVSSFEDAWAQYLVDEGAACEFDMGAEWTTTITAEPAPPMFDPDNIPRSDGECCEVHDEVGCSVDECQQVVCIADPYCCQTQWEALCVDAARAVEACGCDPASDGGSEGGTDGGGDPPNTTCEGKCGAVVTNGCSCDSQCTELMDCCDDFAMLCG